MPICDDWLIMKLTHFEQLAPVCPLCRVLGRGEPKLEIARKVEQSGNDLIAGILQCSDAQCQMEYPIIDGIPIIHSNVRGQIETNLLHLIARDDLPVELESLVSDAVGPGSAFDSMKQALSTYAWDHYGDLNPDLIAQEGAVGPDILSDKSGHRPGSALRCLQKGFELMGATPSGIALDLGCAVGRTSFEIAGHTQDLVLGVDLNFSMLRVASRVLREGQAVYPERRVGVVYERREFPVEFNCADSVDFWCCDALCLPFSSETFGFISALNILDCISAPLVLLQVIEKILIQGGSVVACSPYDWSPAATPIEGWLGGHSQRGENKGDSASIVQALLTPGALPVSLRELELVGASAQIPWFTRVHERSTVEYQTHLVVARRNSGS